MSGFTENFWKDKTVQLTMDIKDPKAFAIVVDHIFGDMKEKLILGAEITGVRWDDSREETIGKEFVKFLAELKKKNIEF